MMYQVYWMNKQTRERHHGYCEADTPEEAYDITSGKLQAGCIVTHVYRADGICLTPQDITINFPNTSDYTLF